MFKNLIETSITTLVFTYFYRKYKLMVKIIMEICKDSCIYIWTKKLSGDIKVYFQYSSLARIIRIKEKQGLSFLDNSRFHQYIINLYKICKTNFSHYLNNTSKLISSIYKTKEEFYSLPVKAISIIVITAVIINTFLSFILKRDIILGDWLLRTLFLLIGVSGLFFNLDWQTLKEHSFILKLITKR